MPQHHFIISPRLSVGRRQKASNAVCQVIITESHSKSTIDSAALEVIRRYSVCVCVPPERASRRAARESQCRNEYAVEPRPSSGRLQRALESRRSNGFATTPVVAIQISCQSKPRTRRGGQLRRQGSDGVTGRTSWHLVVGCTGTLSDCGTFPL